MRGGGIINAPVQVAQSVLRSQPDEMLFASLKAWRALVCDRKGVFKRYASCPQSPFVEKASNQRHSVRHAPRRRKRWQRMLRVRSPITSRLLHFDKSRAQGK
jgi:hypothetical protein